MAARYREQQQMWLALPVVPAKRYTVIERINDDSVHHNFDSLTDAITYVAVHGKVPEADGEQLREWLLSGREWPTSRVGLRGRFVTRHWRLTTWTKR